jgi:hypothetical protein
MGIERLGHDCFAIAYNQRRLMAPDGIVEANWREVVDRHK